MQTLRIMGLMFFRRQHLKIPTFAERLETLRSAAFTLTPMAGGVVRASRGGCAVDLKDDQALGTVSTFYLYDRVKDRDRGVPKRVWESERTSSK